MMTLRIAPGVQGQFAYRTCGMAVLLFTLCAPVRAQIAADALVTGAYDGDTIYVEAAIWPNMTWTGGVRVLGVDTPEIRGSCELEKNLAVMARDYVRTLLIDKTVRLTQIENDKYGGRVLARVYFWEGETWVDLANRLIEQRMGRFYEGGARPDWCQEENPGDTLESDGLGWREEDDR